MLPLPASRLLCESCLSYTLSGPQAKDSPCPRGHCLRSVGAHRPSPLPLLTQGWDSRMEVGALQGPQASSWEETGYREGSALRCPNGGGSRALDLSSASRVRPLLPR